MGTRKIYIKNFTRLDLSFVRLNVYILHPLFLLIIHDHMILVMLIRLHMFLMSKMQWDKMWYTGYTFK
jgi:hypothetical protein